MRVNLGTQLHYIEHGIERYNKNRGKTKTTTPNNNNRLFK